MRKKRLLKLRHGVFLNAWNQFKKRKKEKEIIQVQSNNKQKKTLSKKNTIKVNIDEKTYEIKEKKKSCKLFEM